MTFTITIFFSNMHYMQGLECGVTMKGLNMRTWQYFANNCFEKNCYCVLNLNSVYLHHTQKLIWVYIKEHAVITYIFIKSIIISKKKVFDLPIKEVKKTRLSFELRNMKATAIAIVFLFSIVYGGKIRLYQTLLLLQLVNRVCTKWKKWSSR